MTQPFLNLTPHFFASPSRRAFSLVELSIVLVILGLLVGGILTAQSLIRASELRSVTTEFQAYQTAIMTFKDKYLALPGDMNNATDFWGKASNCGVTTGVILLGGTCNGGVNDGIIGPYAGSTYAPYSERYLAWHHLMLAGLIDGVYSGATGSAHVYNSAIPGVNVPKSRLLSDAAWCFNHPGTLHHFALNYERSLVLSRAVSGSAHYCSNAANSTTSVLKPQEALGIDGKIDDGQPAKGKVIGYPSTKCTNAHTNSTMWNAEYRTSSDDKDCALIFMNIY